MLGVRLGLPLQGLQGVFDYMDDALADPRRFPPGYVAARLAARHQRRSTVLGQGCALPHAEIRHLRRTALFYLRPLQAFATDGGAEPVRDVLVQLAPYPSAPRDHALLKHMQNALMNPSFVQQLRACATRDTVVDLLQHHLALVDRPWSPDAAGSPGAHVA